MCTMSPGATDGTTSLLALCFCTRSIVPCGELDRGYCVCACIRNGAPGMVELVCSGPLKNPWPSGGCAAHLHGSEYMERTQSEDLRRQDRNTAPSSAPDQRGGAAKGSCMPGALCILMYLKVSMLESSTFFSFLCNTHHVSLNLLLLLK